MSLHARLAAPEADDRMHLATERPEDDRKPIHTKCGIKLDSCSYENFLLTECEEVFFRHTGECCADCSAEVLKELMGEDHLGG